MVADIPGKIIMRFITDGHETFTVELSRCYFIQFMPDLHLHQGKPALRVSQRLYLIHEHHNSSHFFSVHRGDSTNRNTGWRVGIDTHLERLLNCCVIKASTASILMNYPFTTLLLPWMAPPVIIGGQWALYISSSHK